MAPKRSAAPPPPPPQVTSSAETASGSGSEEDEEEEIAQSTPPAAPKSIAPPPQKDQESDASDEDEDGEEDEEEDEGEEEEGEDEDEKANHVSPSSATKNPPPPPPPASREEPDSSDEEEEGADEEMPQAKPAPNQEMEAKGAKRPPFQRTWSTEDEFRILEVLAAHRLEHGTLPKPDVLANALDGKLDNRGCSHSDLQKKVKSLQSWHIKAVKKGDPPSKDHARRLFDLCNNVWPSASKVFTKGAANSGALREPDEMCKLYPYLAEEVKTLHKTHPGLFKREFAMIDDSKARALDDKIKKLRHTQMNLHMRRHGLIRDVTKTLMDMTE